METAIQQGRVAGAGRSRGEVGGRLHHPLDPLYLLLLHRLVQHVDAVCTVIDCDRDHPDHQLEAATPKFVTDVKYAAAAEQGGACVY